MYNPADWYWIVAGDESRTWSSARTAYVPATDGIYIDWLSVGNAPTRIAAEDDLREVLAEQYPQGWPGGDSVAILGAGCAIVSAGAHAAVTGTWSLDSATQFQIAVAASTSAQFGLPLGRSTFNYPDKNGAPHGLSVGDLGVLFTTIRDYVTEVLEAAAAKAAGGEASYPSLPVSIT